MTLQETIVPFFTHFIPILIFIFIMLHVLLRNPQRSEHWLVAAIIFCSMMMFLEEFVRHFLPIEYSPVLTASWFGISGITITGLGLHLFVKLTQIERKFPKFVYPYLFYLPVIIALINLFFNDQMIAGNEFQQIGIWKTPVYNTAYYIAMIGSNFFGVLYIIILARGKVNAYTHEQREIYNQLMIGIFISLSIHMIIGLPDFKGILPPYPYIYGELVWSLILWHTMLKYDFLNDVDKRYERLFNLNPAAILLMDLKGEIKEANPSAKQLFNLTQLNQINGFSLLNEDATKKIEAHEPLHHIEMTIQNKDKELDVLIDGDYVMVDHQPHLILIVRDITLQKANQKEISFLAYHDPLTRLPNRRYFYEHFDRAIEKARQDGNMLAVAMLDLDYFKEINDVYGHHIGDQALEFLSDQIRHVFTPPDYMAARLGGDEFAVLFLTEEAIQSIDEKFHQLRAILDSNKFKVGNKQIAIQISIGVSIYPDNGWDRVSLMRNADKALYQVKRQGRNSLAYGAGVG